MSLLVQPRLINPPTGDPGLYLDFQFGRRAMLFDLGDTGPLSPRELIRVSHVFVSHAHMDHVAGLERLLRLRLHRPRPLTLLGPPDFVAQMQNRLGAYSWNLLDKTAVDFRLTVHGFDGTRVVETAQFRAQERFARRDMDAPDLPPGVVLTEPEFEIHAAALDHGIPSLAFAFRQRQRLNVWRTALVGLGLPVGPWIDAAKQALREGRPDTTPIAVAGAGEVPLGRLRTQVFRASPGQSFGYVTDAADSPENRARIAALAKGVDLLFIEAPFLQADRTVAEATRHLTARAAGQIARAAGARRVIPFHHSARYGDETRPLAEELRAAFEAG